MPSLLTGVLLLLPVLLASAGVVQAQIQEAQAEAAATAAGDSGGSDIETTGDIASASIISLDFGEPFAVELNFISQTHIFEGREVEAEADFLNTGNLTLVTDTPGVTVEPIPAATPVPGFGAVGLALLVILVGVSTALLARYRRRRAQTHSARTEERPGPR